MKYKILFAIIICFLISGCYTEKHIVDPLQYNQEFKISSESTIYIGLTEDGKYGSTIYDKSGEMTQNAIKLALMRHIRNIMEGSKTESFNESLKSAKYNGFEYLIYPTILHWEDRATEWSGLSDKIEIQISVTDTKTEREMSAVRIKSNSSWWTFGGDHPQDLLEKPISKYIDSLF